MVAAENMITVTLISTLALVLILVSALTLALTLASYPLSRRRSAFHEPLTDTHCSR